MKGKKQNNGRIFWLIEWSKGWLPKTFNWHPDEGDLLIETLLNLSFARFLTFVVFSLVWNVCEPYFYINFFPFETITLKLHQVREIFDQIQRKTSKLISNESMKKFHFFKSDKRIIIDFTSIFSKQFFSKNLIFGNPPVHFTLRKLICCLDRTPLFFKLIENSKIDKVRWKLINRKILRQCVFP